VDRSRERFWALVEVDEHVEDHRGGAHVGHVVATDGGVDGGTVESTEADVGPTDGCHPPCESPPVGMEHR